MREVGAPQLRQMEQLVDALRRVLDLEACATQSELKQPAAPDGGPRAQVPLPAAPAVARASAPIQQASQPNSVERCPRPALERGSVRRNLSRISQSES